jgi:hypothetical protein
MRVFRFSASDYHVSSTFIIATAQVDILQVIRDLKRKQITKIFTQILQKQHKE